MHNKTVDFFPNVSLLVQKQIQQMYQQSTSMIYV